MGSFNSIEAKDKKKEDLIFDIQVKGNRLNRLYTEKYLYPEQETATRFIPSVYFGEGLRAGKFTEKN